MGQIELLESRRLLAGGTPDPIWVDQPIEVPGGAETAHLVRVDSSGRIVLAGHWQEFLTQSTPGVRRVAIQRFRPDGTPDTSFGGDGAIEISPHGMNNLLGLVRLDDGRMIIVGQRPVNRFQVILTRVTASGKVDRSFGRDGIVVVPFRSNLTNGTAIVSNLTPDGKLILGGVVNSPAAPTDRLQIELVQIDPLTGKADRDFGNNGVSRASFDVVNGDDLGRRSEAVSIHVYESGAIHVGVKLARHLGDPGDTNPANYDYTAAIARFEADGGVDTSYGADGLAQMPSGDVIVSGPIPTLHFANESDGEAVAIFSGGDYATLWKFAAGGQSDETFSENGLAAFRTIDNFAAVINGIARQDDDKWVVTVTDLSPGAFLPRPVVYRFNAGDYTMDTTFGIDGRRQYEEFGNAVFNDVALAPDGTIVGAGVRNETIIGPSFERDMLVARYLADDGPHGLFLGQNFFGTYPPAASLPVKVLWRSDEPMDLTRLGNNDVLFESPTGELFFGSPRTMQTLANGAVLGTYRLWRGHSPSPSGVWTATVRFGATQDIGNDFSAEHVIGRFTVLIP